MPMYGKCKAGGIMILLNRSLSYLQRYIFLCETAACCAAKAEKRRKVWCFWIKIERSLLWENPHVPIRIFLPEKLFNPLFLFLTCCYRKRYRWTVCAPNHSRMKGLGPAHGNEIIRECRRQPIRQFLFPRNNFSLSAWNFFLSLK